MTNKELIIQNFNNFIKETLVPNKLSIIIENNQAAGIPFESLKLVDIYFDEAETDWESRDEYVYETLVHVFNIGDTSFKLTTDFNNNWGGLYPLENYTIHYENKENHLVRNEKEEFVDYGLHNFFNNYDFSNIAGGYDILFNFRSEHLQELSSSKLSAIKKVIPNIQSVEAISTDTCVLHFEGNCRLTVYIDEVKALIKNVNNN